MDENFSDAFSGCENLGKTAEASAMQRRLAVRPQKSHGPGR